MKVPWDPLRNFRLDMNVSYQLCPFRCTIHYRCTYLSETVLGATTRKRQTQIIGTGNIVNQSTMFPREPHIEMKA